MHDSLHMKCPKIQICRAGKMWLSVGWQNVLKLTVAMVARPYEYAKKSLNCTH